jgi:cobalt/nickel transport system permease protein
MHIPDGFIAPQVYLPAYAVAAVGWALALRRLRATLDETTLPRLAVLTALSFVLMTVAIPLPGGTTVHAEGIALLAVNFGIATAFLAASIVLALQALMFGAGGLTALPVNAIALGLVGAAVAVGVRRLAGRRLEAAGLFAAGFLSVLISALLVATVLGLQPAIARDEAGAPLFFPFGLAVTLPAVVLPHLVVGLGEGALTLGVTRLLQRLQQGRA